MEIPATLREHCGGDTRAEVASGSVRAVVRALDAAYPGFAERLGTEFAVAIDGEIIHDAWLETVPAGAELHFLPAISGGSVDLGTVDREDFA